MFNFKELPLWNVVKMAKSSKDMMHVASFSTQTEDPLSLSSGGTVEQLPLVSQATPYSPLQYLAPGPQTCSPPTRNSPLSVRMEPITPTLAATLSHSRASTPWATLSSHSPSSAKLPPSSKTLDAEGTSLTK